MQTLKTAVVVVLLLAVMYGAYVALNAPQPVMPDEFVDSMREFEPDLDIDFGAEVPSLEIPPPATTPSPAGSLAMAGLDATDPESITRLPAPDPATSGGAPDPNRDYPRTDAADVALPEPDAAAAVVGAPADFQLLGPQADAEQAAPPEAGAVAANLSDATAEAGSRSPSPAPESPAPESASPGSKGFKNALTTADQQVAEGRLREALFTLSVFYGSPDLDEEQFQQLLKRLDPLAGEVIYSQRHLVEKSHRVGRGETLRDVAKLYEVPWELLANINQIDAPDALLPGTELKVVRGPFRAEVDLARSEITVFLGELYAGRFPFVAGNQPAPAEGAYEVRDKRTDRAYYGAGGQTVPAGDPRNPYGDIWLDLGNEMCIHGSPDVDSGAEPAGCIRLSPIDARDLYTILAKGSPVTVRR